MHIERQISKTGGDPFPGFHTIYLLPTITVSFYKSLRESLQIYIEITWIKWMVRYIIYK